MCLEKGTRGHHISNYFRDSLYKSSKIIRSTNWSIKIWDILKRFLAPSDQATVLAFYGYSEYCEDWNTTIVRITVDVRLESRKMTTIVLGYIKYNERNYSLVLFIISATHLWQNWTIKSLRQYFFATVLSKTFQFVFYRPVWLKCFSKRLDRVRLQYLLCNI